MKTLVITAGRNIENTPMSDQEWNLLRANVARILASVGAEIFTSDAIGSGQWTDDAGVTITEQSVTYVGSVQDNVISLLEHQIARLARQFKQDAIALVIGESLLIRGA